MCLVSELLHFVLNQASLQQDQTSSTVLKLFLNLVGELKLFHVNDVHDKCLLHNDTCWVNHIYDPRNCDTCLALINSFKNKEPLASAIFTNRIKNMRRSFRLAHDKNSLPQEVRERFEKFKGLDIWLPEAKHLDPFHSAPHSADDRLSIAATFTYVSPPPTGCARA